MRFPEMKQIRGYFLAGILTLAPLVLTIYVAWQLFQAFDGLLNKHVTYVIFSILGIESHNKVIPGIGLFALVALILVTGFIAKNYLGKRLIALGDSVMSRLPVVRHIYSTLQQISHAFLSEHNQTFKRTVIFEYPRPGMYSLGFITQDTKGAVQKSLNEQVYSIFLPTTPNPTSGYLLFIPKKSVIPVNISVEEALKLIISGGSINIGQDDFARLEESKQSPQ